MLSGFNVLDVTLKCLEFSYTMFMCSNGEKVMSFCKVYIHKMAFLLNNPLNFTPSHLQKEKKWLNIQNRHSWFENSKELRKWYTFSVYFSALYWPLQFCNQCLDYKRCLIVHVWIENMYENLAIHKNALEIDFNHHHHYIMTNLFKCFNFQWQVPPEKLSCTYVL